MAFFRLAVAVLQTFIDSGEVGLIGKLVLKIKLFLAAAKAGREKDKKGKKRERDEAKAQRLQEAMMKEQKNQVKSSTMHSVRLPLHLLRRTPAPSSPALSCTTSSCSRTHARET